MDGDTIEVLHNGSPLRVRLYGIDTPERRQDFGATAKQFTSERVGRRFVEIVPVEHDKYERMVAKVYVNGKYLNLMLVEAGLAWWYARYAPNDQALAKAEQLARESKVGLWSHPNPVAPWLYRRAKVSKHSNRPTEPVARELGH